MKKLSVLLMLLTIKVWAADLNLSSGESAIIQPNVRTNVTCNGSSSGSSCKEATDGLVTLVDACKSSYSASYCIDKYWPTFKKQNPACVNAALNYCIDNCKTSYSASYCADQCTK